MTRRVSAIASIGGFGNQIEVTMTLSSDVDWNAAQYDKLYAVRDKLEELVMHKFRGTVITEGSIKRLSMYAESLCPLLVTLSLLEVRL